MCLIIFSFLLTFRKKQKKILFEPDKDISAFQYLADGLVKIYL